MAILLASLLVSIAENGEGYVRFHRLHLFLLSSTSSSSSSTPYSHSPPSPTPVLLHPILPFSSTPYSCSPPSVFSSKRSRLLTVLSRGLHSREFSQKLLNVASGESGTAIVILEACPTSHDLLRLKRCSSTTGEEHVYPDVLEVRAYTD